MPFKKGQPKIGGKRKGYVHDATREKEAARAKLREIVYRELVPMVEAQVEHARGVNYLMLRNNDGSFTRATDVAQVDAACAAGASSFKLFTQSPNPQAFKDLMDRALDKPADHVELANDLDKGPLVIQVKKPW